jgi:hypothetical protein
MLTHGRKTTDDKLERFLSEKREPNIGQRQVGSEEKDEGTMFAHHKQADDK